MSVNKTKDGQWYFKVRYVDALTGEIKQKFGRATSRSEAKRKEAEFIIKVRDEPLTRLTFGDVCNKYLHYQKDNIQEDTYKQISYRIDYFFESLKNKQITKMKPNDIVEWKKWMNTLTHNTHGYESNYSTTTKNDILTLMISIFKYANKFLALNFNPALQVEKFKKTVSDIKEYRIITIDEMESILEAISEDVNKLYFELVYFTGLRKNEARSLQIKDYNRTRRQISINKNLLHRGTQPIEWKLPKTVASIRVVGLDSILAKKIAKHIDGMKKLDDYNDEWFLFGGPFPINTSKLDNVFKKALKDIGFDKNTRIHDLRHSHATLLMANGSNNWNIAKRLGHTDTRFTEKTYAHYTEQIDSENVAQIDKLRKNGIKMVSETPKHKKKPLN